MKIFNLYTKQEFYYTKLLFQRSLAFIYFIAFLILFNQGKALIGSHGLTPANLFIERSHFWDAPSLFFLNSSDATLTLFSCLGIIISLLGMMGITERFGHFVSIGSWFILWLVYLSFVSIGQVWYAFAWESLLLETGFLAIFLGPRKISPPRIIIWALRWVCFRNIFGSGMIKLRGDQCWKDLTCLFVYYETQPIPNPLSPLFHALPKFIHKASVLWTFIVELIMPFAMLTPWGLLCALAGIVMIIFQGLIIVSGNLSWFNYLSIVLVIPCFNDEFIKKVFPFTRKDVLTQPIPTLHQWSTYLLGALILWRSWGPVANLLSSRQVMNRSFDRLRLVNTYGAFGTITKKRNELVILGTQDHDPSNAKWLAYEFKGKPTNPQRMPSIMGPYEWKLDWQLWFAAFGHHKYSPWTLNLVAKLLSAQPEILNLLAQDPFHGQKPKWIKIDYYNYTFKKLNESGVWQRVYLDQWLPPLNLEHPQFVKILKTNKWL